VYYRFDFAEEVVKLQRCVLSDDKDECDVPDKFHDLEKLSLKPKYRSIYLPTYLPAYMLD
jgi:hypothetical protein